MKRTIRLLALVLCLCVLAAAPALADMSRGDSSDEVYELQKMLFETGFLFEEPDGQFGRNTEEAVRWYQETMGLEETGVVTDEVLEHITETWIDCMIDIYGDDFFEESGYSIGTPEFCDQWVMPDGSNQINYCERHKALWEEAQELICSESVSDVWQAVELWQIEIVSLYDEWAEALPADSQGAVVAAKAMFMSALETQKASMIASSLDEGWTAQTLECWLRNQAAWLCNVIYSVKLAN